MKADTNMVLCVLVCVLIVLVLYRIIVKACQRKEQFYQPMGPPPRRNEGGMGSMEGNMGGNMGGNMRGDMGNGKGRNPFMRGSSALIGPGKTVDDRDDPTGVNPI